MPRRRRRDGSGEEFVFGSRDEVGEGNWGGEVVRGAEEGEQAV